MQSGRADFQLDSIAPHILSTESSVREALTEVEAWVADAEVEDAIDILLSVSNLLEFVISASPSCADRLSSYVLDYFPGSASTFASSPAHRMLQRFWSYLFFLRRSFPAETARSLEDCRMPVELAPPVLQAISTLVLSDAIEPPANPDANVDPLCHIGSRHKRKRGKRANITANTEPFRKLGVDAPSTPQAAEQLTTSILQDQKRILEYYLSILRRPHLSHIFKNEYIAQGAGISPAPASTVQEPAKPGVVSETSNVIPSAYPMVQPMKAALYFDSAVGFGEWRILLSTRATQNLREARRTDAKLFKIIVKKIKELSNGHFSDDNQKRLNGPTTDVPIYEAKMTRDQRLVYQVDCIPEYNSDMERQVLRIFGIYTHAQLDRRLWDSMGTQLARKGKEYRQRCNFRNRPYHTGDNVIMPASFPAPEAVDTDPETSVLDLPREDLDELHSLLVLEKFVAFSQALLNSIIADQDVAHVFSVTPQEKEIIEHITSCYVLGRSGTGKTTTMLFKMLGIERAWAMHSSNDLAKPRQLFVTQSRVLAGKVEEYFSKLMESLATASYSPRELANLAKTKQAHQEEGLVDLDDETNWRNDLPQRFSFLDERHFPLFITFDRLCQLLEADIVHSRITQKLLATSTAFDGIENSVLGQETNPPWSRDRIQVIDRRQLGSFISYDVFLQSYWPHFSQSLTKGLDPSLVFSEFLGIIKGSEKALTCAERFLDQKSYDSLSHRSQSTFSTQRNTIYAIFQLYVKRKRERQDHDSADRTHWILDEFLDRGVPGEMVDFLYVDEAQDNLLIDALLLRSLCRNPDGLFWAGDTAQTISVGSSFRFNDLKAFLFRVEERNASASDVSRAPIPPRSFQLAVNYRSHGGIVNCAHSVIELITRLWPHAIDNLAQEKGIVDGLKPIFFHGWNSDTVRYEQFLFGASGSHIEFGAQQCILVRDQAARNKLREEVGDIGLIMTLYESKGLEFNDVLLYNFFEDSTVDVSQWRVILNALESHQVYSVAAPTFNDTRHAGVCSELKFLYVAITRARKNMWIVDCSETGEPMRMFWTTKNLVQNCIPGADVPRLAVSSTPEEWADFGKSLFQHKRYIQAMHCFERAFMDREVAVAKAYSLREQARAMPSGHHHHETAANAFIACAIAATKEKRAYFRIAGDCFASHGDDVKAAMAYLNGKEYTLAAERYRKAGRFDDAVNIIKAHRQEMPLKIVESIVGVARLVYFRNFELDKATDLFSSTEEALEFVVDYDLDIARATLLEQAKRYGEAAEVHIAEGRSVEGIRIFLENLSDEHCTRRAVICVLQALWRNLSFGVLPVAARLDKILEHWLKLASRLDRKLMSQRDRDEIIMFQAIIARDAKQLQQLGFKFYDDNKPAALLCLDQIFIAPPLIQGATIQETISSLEMFYAYTRLVHDIAGHADPCNDRPVQKLFAFEVSREDVFSIHPGTFLYGEVADQQALFFRGADGKRLVSRRDLSRVLKHSLGERLRSRVMQENEICRRAKVFSPCINAFLGTCAKTTADCPRDHVDLVIMKPDWYNNRVRIHLQQIQIFQSLHFVRLGAERGKQQIYWLDRLYEALNPYFYVYGCRANLQLSLIPGAERALVVVKDWVRHMIYTNDPYKYSNTFLTTFLRSAILSFDHDGKEAFDYIVRARCMTYRRPPRPLVRKDQNVYIMKDLINSLHGIQTSCLSTGIIFVRHVVAEMLPINVSLLCDFIEKLCGSLVVSKRLQLTPTLHDVTLPKSWLFGLTNDIKLHRARDTRLYSTFVEPMLLLLGRMHTGSHTEHLLFETRDLSRLSGPIRYIFIFRVCKALCLLGMNVRNPGLRDKILHGISALNKRDRALPSLYRRYFEATQWGHLAMAVEQSTNNSPMDEMVQLLQEGRIRGPLFPAPGVRHIVFVDLEQIPHLLAAAHSTSSLTTKPRVQVSPPDSRGATRDVTVAYQDSNTHSALQAAADHELPSYHNRPIVSADSDMVDSELTEEVEEQNSTDQLGLNASVDVDTLVHPVDSTTAQDAVVAHSDEQIEAACVIQAMYRRNVERRGGGTRSTLSEARSRLFIKCWAECEMLKWPRSPYRLLFLGPLPHLLLCLERANTFAFEAKMKVKRRLTTAKHQELEDVQTKMTEANRVLKELLRLQQALEPKAIIHKNRDLQTLKVRVQEVEVLIRGLPYAPELQEDLRLAVKGIVTETLRKKKLKPALCMDDDVYDYMG